MRRQIQVNLRVSAEELAAIEAPRGGLPRNSWIRRLIKQGLAAEGLPMLLPVADPATAAPKGTTVVGATEQIARYEAQEAAKRAKREAERERKEREGAEGALAS